MQHLFNFLNANHLNEDTQKFWEENKREQKFPVKGFQKFVSTSYDSPFLET